MAIPLPLPLFLLLLKLSGRRRRFESAENLHRAVHMDRRRDNGVPPDTLTQRFAVERLESGGRNCYRLSPRDASRAGSVQLLYLHGGAHVAEMAPQHWNLVAELVERSECTAYVPIYPLAPEAGHREAFAYLEPLFNEVASRSDPFVLMGDSSGAGLALVLAQRALARGLPAPREIALISPWLDLTLGHARRAAGRIRDPWLDLPGLEEAARWWAQGKHPALPELSPLYGELRGLPRLSVFTSDRDMLFDEARELRARALRAGVTVAWEEEADHPHVWPILPLRAALHARDLLVAMLV